MRNVLPCPPKVIFRQPPNLKKLLVRASLNKPKDKPNGSYKTHTRNCVTCAVLKETTTFASYSTKEKFTIYNSITCTTKSVIYLINCLSCGKQYVGETGGELRQRHRGHRQELKKGHTPLGKHFNGICTNFELIGIQQIPDYNCHLREQKELSWILQLDTFYPTGINVKKSVKQS